MVTEKDKQNKYYKELGNNLKGLRKVAGLSQTQLATLLGFKNYLAIQFREAGNTPITLYEIVKIAKMFNVELNTLLP